MIQSRILVLEERQEILTETEEAVLLGLVDDRHAKMLLVEIS